MPRIAKWMIPAGAVLGLIIAAAVPAAANDLEMYIENTTTDVLIFEQQSGVDYYPHAIQPGTTSTDIKAHKKGNNEFQGDIVYGNAKCTAGVGFVGYVAGSGKCDDKSFTLHSTGQCKIERDGDCYGASNCNCNFKVTAQ